MVLQHPVECHLPHGGAIEGDHEPLGGVEREGVSHLHAVHPVTGTNNHDVI